jgi:esterase/lipase superfamily enzyme
MTNQHCGWLIRVACLLSVTGGSCVLCGAQGGAPRMTCDVIGSKIQGSTVIFSAHNYEGSREVEWDIDGDGLKHQSTPGQTAQVSLANVEPNTFISGKFYEYTPDHKSNNQLCSEVFSVEVRVLQQPGKLPDPYGLARQVTHESKSDELGRISKSKLNTISWSLAQSDYLLSGVEINAVDGPDTKSNYQELETRLQEADDNLDQLIVENQRLFAAASSTGDLTRNTNLSNREDDLSADTGALRIEIGELRQRAEPHIYPPSQVPPTAAPPAAPPAPPPSEAVAGVLLIKVFYATDREPSSGHPGEFLKARGDGTVHYGSAIVSIPSAHTRGQIEEPQWWRFEFTRNPAKDVVMYSPRELTPEGFLPAIRNHMSGTSKEVLVFIHGYNNSFSEVIQRTAQIASDLKFDGVPLTYDWASLGALHGYEGDEQSAAASKDNLASFLKDIVAKTGATSINIVAHSMGNQALLSALEELALEHRMIPIHNLIFAAPDVDDVKFKQQVERVMATRKVNRFTLYASSKDVANWLAGHLDEAPVAGEGGAKLIKFAGLDSIDATAISRGDLLDHGYYADTDSALADLAQMINFDWDPAKRTYLHPNGVPIAYWSLVNAP